MHFGTAANIHDLSLQHESTCQHHRRVLPANNCLVLQGKYIQIVAEKLLFLAYNIRLLGFNYETVSSHSQTMFHTCFVENLYCYCWVPSLLLSSLLSIYSTFFLTLFHILSLLLSRTDGGLGLFSNNERAQGAA